jgi:hypothetical protein
VEGFGYRREALADVSIVGRVGAGVEVVADNVAQCLVSPLTTPRRQPSSSADPRWALLNRLSITRDERLTQWPRRRQFSLGGPSRTAKAVGQWRPASAGEHSVIIRAAKLLGIGAGFSAANHADRQYIPGFPPQLP